MKGNNCDIIHLEDRKSHSNAPSETFSRQGSDGTNTRNEKDQQAEKNYYYFQYIKNAGMNCASRHCCTKLSLSVLKNLLHAS